MAFGESAVGIAAFAAVVLVFCAFCGAVVFAVYFLIRSSFLSLLRWCGRALLFAKTGLSSSDAVLLPFVLAVVLALTFNTLGFLLVVNAVQLISSVWTAGATAILGALCAGAVIVPLFLLAVRALLRGAREWLSARQFYHDCIPAVAAGSDEWRLGVLNGGGCDSCRDRFARWRPSADGVVSYPDTSWRLVLGPVLVLLGLSIVGALRSSRDVGQATTAFASRALLSQRLNGDARFVTYERALVGMLEHSWSLQPGEHVYLLMRCWARWAPGGTCARLRTPVLAHHFDELRTVLNTNPEIAERDGQYISLFESQQRLQTVLGRTWSTTVGSDGLQPFAGVQAGECQFTETAAAAGLAASVCRLTQGDGAAAETGLQVYLHHTGHQERAVGPLWVLAALEGERPTAAIEHASVQRRLCRMGPGGCPTPYERIYRGLVTLAVLEAAKLDRAGTEADTERGGRWQQATAHALEAGGWPEHAEALRALRSGGLPAAWSAQRLETEPMALDDPAQTLANVTSGAFQRLQEPQPR